MISAEELFHPEQGGSLEPAPASGRPLPPLSKSLGGFTQDDPRVIAALEAYLEDQRAGRPCSQAEFLARHS